jgi:hypothetical protein
MSTSLSASGNQAGTFLFFTKPDNNTHFTNVKDGACLASTFLKELQRQI